MALATDTLRLFAEYDWPGNVRELENLVKRDGRSSGPTSRSAASWPTRSPAGRCASGPIPALQPRAAAAPAGGAAGRRRRRRRRRPAPRAGAVIGSLKDIARHAAREAERELIYRTLQQTRWNRREAAEILGISYKALLYKIKEAELDKAS